MTWKFLEFINGHFVGRGKDRASGEQTAAVTVFAAPIKVFGGSGSLGNLTV